ncbi:MAG: hypothetical protein A3H72_03540 [Candidatus Doudnabacteria bacterium RIFCSPLOWO2_02_FULL_48_8]|uniref:PDZ domain-containing protein n=1 Tax=Candidatus Doudnabacteria bacterium RIFCSPHIGHO2_01_FULL_46_24 TaxID=1817825 RepID=A0A1F5NU68_9BACT|nr:MAG: hypothetical protein A2720_01610 [Candidatus Doudnabacteria bacterium RIFCSPHIGHO2_01_FULL_46_24]OGE94948.1 MAG: hypothetical protein A3H72_03540 [Candidatus Doudnabacteria bacterium RIFCSPLOWO2_02_FULL_48_8]OGE95686.1 MAG: hypothetical protein A3E98_02070 [Candidatus Doudnabacteria bacterium RIFCSPHIGHO2_12_FULL_48_11]
MTKKQIFKIILIALIAGAAGGIIFDRLLIPQLGKVRGFGWLTKLAVNAPIVITRTEEVVLNEGANFIELAKKATNSTVSFYGKNLNYLGNGVILSSDGLVFTSKTVVGNLDEVLVQLVDGAVFEGVVRALDPKSDVAVVTVDAHNLAVMPFAEAAKMSAGQKILTVGQSNREFVRDFAVGSITRGVGNNKGLHQVFFSETLLDAFETDADLNHGFAGSPILNLEGRLVGMHADGAAKIVVAENMQTALSSYLSSGKIMRPYLGLRYIELSKASALLRGFDQQALLVVGTDNKSPADKAGLLPSDLIFEIDGEKFNGKTFEQILNSHAIGPMKVKTLRGEQDLEITINLEATK